MDGGLTITFISVAMFVGCFFLGFIPLLFRFSEKSLQFVSILGAGLLCGTALAVVIPEGVGLLEESWRAQRNSVGITATLGLVIHAAADGFALGAAVATGQVTVQVIVFFAVILHKAPAAFGLVSFLMHAGLEKKYIQGHLLAFSAAAPIVAIATYFILHASQLSATGVGMLFSFHAAHVGSQLSLPGHLIKGPPVRLLPHPLPHVKGGPGQPVRLLLDLLPL
uniref:Zinc transporter ZIP9 n=1 Tax=Sparus aurata TaxID=8175 RepID=A0A671YQ15_SPAAU